ELLAKNVSGIAISPIDPDNQGDLLEQIASRTHLITHDSDAPNSKRLCYVGMDNYDAGRMCGKLVKDALPEGGNVMIFVGRVSQANARARRQGVIDELMDRSSDPKRYDEGPEIRGQKYVILDTKTDGFDFAKAKQLAQDAMTKHPDLGCMVGLFEYNPPILLDAVREAGKLKKIKIVAFRLGRGEVLAVVGENGAGKSTLMKLVAGVHRPDAGQIYLDEKPVTVDSVHTALELGIAFIHQELNLAENLDVGANIFLGRE